MTTTRRILLASCAVAILGCGVPYFVAAPLAQTRPKNATAQCKDGTYSTAKTKQGACSKHGGVATWFADETPAPTTKTPSAPTQAPAATTQTPPPTKTPSSTKAAPKGTTSGAPENATAKCKDGTYSHAKQHSGACSHHGGVAEWYK